MMLSVSLNNENAPVLMHLTHRVFHSHFAPLMSPDVVSWCHTTSWHHIIDQGVVSSHSNQNEYVKLLENHISHPGDLVLWPITLTSELILEVVQVHINTKLFSRNGSIVKVHTNIWTHTHKDGINSVTSTASARVNLSLLYSQCH